jgi:hypothetical protein
LNIKSYAATLNAWKNTQKMALNTLNNTTFNQQDSGDGKLEFMTFESVLGLGLERFCGGRARKIC